MNYTPGPWKTEQIMMDIEIGAETPKGHISVAWVHIGQGADCDEIKSALADAELIAAAPELLEALKEMTPESDDWWCSACKESLDGSRVTHQECCVTCGTYLGGLNAPSVVSKARATIAKAEGKKP